MLLVVLCILIEAQGAIGDAGEEARVYGDLGYNLLSCTKF